MSRLPAPAASRTGRDVLSRTLWRWYLAVGVLTALPLSGNRERWAEWGHSLVHLSTPVAIVIGILRLRPARPLFWWLLAAGQLWYSLALTDWRIRVDGWQHDVPFRSADDAVLITGIALIARLGMLAGVAHRRAAERRPYGPDHIQRGYLRIEGGPDPSEALRHVDLALYRAKTSGKNQVVRYHEGLRGSHLTHSGTGG